MNTFWSMSVLACGVAVGLLAPEPVNAIAAAMVGGLSFAIYRGNS